MKVLYIERAGFEHGGMECWHRTIIEAESLRNKTDLIGASPDAFTAQAKAHNYLCSAILAPRLVAMSLREGRPCVRTSLKYQPKADKVPEHYTYTFECLAEGARLECRVYRME
jgi:hypothetical protein